MEETIINKAKIHLADFPMQRIWKTIAIVAKKKITKEIRKGKLWKLNG